jgi:hypothetical protein
MILHRMMAPSIVGTFDTVTCSTVTHAGAFEAAEKPGDRSSMKMTDNRMYDKTMNLSLCCPSTNCS